MADKTNATVTPTPSQQQAPNLRPTPTVTPSGSARLKGDWKVSALIGNDGTSALTGRYGQTKVRIHFGADILSATTGCNYVFSDYRQSGPGGRDLVFVGETGSTSAYCVGEVELMEVLRDVRHAGEANGVLYLMAENGATVAVLNPSEPHRPYWP